MDITIKNSIMAIKMQGDSRNVPADLTPLEQDCIYIGLLKVMTDPVLLQHISFDRRAGDKYLTISFDIDYDFMRLKATSRSLWFSVWHDPSDEENPLFDSVENRKQLHWKVKLSSPSDLENFQDIIYRAALMAIQEAASSK